MEAIVSAQERKPWAKVQADTSERKGSCQDMKKLKGSKAYKETKQTRTSTLTSYIEPLENLACLGWTQGRRGKERIYLTKKETEESSKVVPGVLIFTQNSKYILFSSMTLFSLLTFIKQTLNYVCGLHFWFTLYFSQTMLVWTWSAIFSLHSFADLSKSCETSSTVISLLLTTLDRNENFRILNCIQ